MQTKTRRTLPKSILVSCLLSALLAGCAALPLPKTITGGDATPRLKKRRAEAAEQFEKHRDLAEFEAAKAQWTQHRDAKACRESLERLLARKPEHRDARLLMAELSLGEDDPDAAYRHAKAALDAYPNDALVQYTVGLTLDAQEKTADALGYYERATKMDPRNETFAAAFQTAREAAREERNASKTTSPPPLREGADIADRLSKVEGTDIQPVSDRETDVAMPEVVETFDDITAECLPTSYNEPSASLPKSAKRTGSRGLADSADSSGVTETGPAGELLRKGHAALNEKSPQAALECFRRAAATNPDNPQIPISAAAAMLRANQPGLAIELLKPAAKRFPSSAAVHRMLGASYYRAGDYKSSQVALQQALSLDKSSALSYLLLGCTLAKLGQNEAAETHFRQARTLDPKFKAVR